MGGLSSSSAAPVGSVAADLGRGEHSLGMGCISSRVTSACWAAAEGLLGLVAELPTVPLQGSRGVPTDSPGLAHPGVWLLQSHQLTQEDTNSPLKGGFPF